MPLEPSPRTQDDDDNNEGMEVRLGFSAEVGLWSKSASVGPFGGTDVPKPGTTTSLFEAWASVEPNPVPTNVEEAAMEEKVVAPLQVPATGPRGLRSRGPRLVVVPQSR